MEKRKAYYILLGLYLLAAGGITIFLLSISANFDNQRIINDNPGFNDNCQRPALSNFDLSVCYGSQYVRPEAESSKKDDTKHSRLFMLYADGAPYAFYKSMLDDPKWKGKLIGIPSRVIGPISSAPIFRAASLGRIDGEFIKDMSMLDNIFGQIYKVAGIQFGLHISYLYPVWHNLGTETFARMDKIDLINDESFNSFCRATPDEGYILMDYNATYGCRDFLECSYPNFKAATAAIYERTAVLRQQLHNRQTSELKACLDKQVGETGGVLVVAIKGDNEAHKYTIVSRKVVESHAIMRANFEFTAEYLLDKYPDCLVAIFSDHGHIENIALSDWVEHGFEEGENTGFMMLLSSKFQTKKLPRSNKPQEHFSLFSHLAVLLQGVNIPALTDKTPYALFEEDPIEVLRLLRLKEMQLRFLLGFASRYSQHDIGDFLKEKKIDTSLTVAELATQLGEEKTQGLLREYKEWLQPLVEKAYASKIAELLGSWYTTGFVAFLVFLGAVCIIVVGLWLQPKILTPTSHSAQLVAFVVFACWFLLHMLSGTFNRYDLWLVGGFLGMLGTILAAAKKPRFSSWYFGYLTALKDIDDQSARFLSLSCFGLSTAVILVRLGFEFMLAESHRVNVWVYALSPVGGYAGMIMVTFWTIVLVIYACHIDEVEPSIDHSIFQLEDHRIREMEQSLLQRDTQIQSRQRWVKGFRIFQVLLILNLLRLLIQYDLKLLHQRSLEHGSDGVAIVWQYYWSVVLSMVASWFGQSDFSQCILLTLYYVNMSFWQNHWNRISYGLILLPAFFWVYTKHRALKAEGNEINRRVREAVLIAILLITQYGYFKANKEDYGLYVNQRSLWRMPTATPDDGNYLFYLHMLNIKACSVLFLLQLLNTVSAQKSVVETNLLVLMHVGWQLVDCFVQIKLGAHWTAFWLMSIIHIILPMSFQCVSLVRQSMQYIVRIRYLESLREQMWRETKILESNQIDMVDFPNACAGSQDK